MQSYVFPLHQHIGQPSEPIVHNGDTVLRGQCIATAPKKGLGSNIFSSITGKVTLVTSSEIQIYPDTTQSKTYQKLTAQNPLDLIRQAGIVGLGGAGFPTYAKLSTSFQHDGMVIINGAECEPILHHNVVRMEKNPKEIIRGLEIAMNITHAAQGVIAIKACHTKAIAALNYVLKDKMKIHMLPDMYPMGEERALVREVMGRLLPITALPIEAGAIVINAESAYRIAQAVDLKKPYIDKDITIGGKIAGNHQEKLIQVYLDEPLGNRVEHLLKKAGGLADTYGEIIMGGPFTGHRVSLQDPIVKTTGGLIATECFPKGPSTIGLLVCACGAHTERMKELAQSMGSHVVDIEYCKQAHEIHGNLKCDNPGKCPGQVQRVMAIKKSGAQGVLISNCTDCSNTVMACAPALGLSVYHCTDGALRAVNHPLIRKIHSIAI